MSLPFDMLFHPEFLTNEQLKHQLKERQLKIPNIECLTRDELLEHFHKFCVPYGQRQKEKRNSKNCTKPYTDSIDTSLSNHQNNNRKHKTYDSIGPPDIIAGQIKRMKMEIDIKDDRHKRKLDLSKQIITEGPPQKKERKLITWP